MRKLVSFFILSGLGGLLSSPLTMAADSTKTLEFGEQVSRGEATQMVIEHFNLRDKNAGFLRDCQAELNFCLQEFSGRSQFSNIQVEPLILYPDVYPAYKYYDDINVATQLDLVRGYFLEENSPFRPEQPISKVEALKIALNAADLLKGEVRFDNSEKFPLKGLNIFKTNYTAQIDLNDQASWWQVPYLNFAEEKNLKSLSKDFYSGKAISREEFEELLNELTSYQENVNSQAIQIINNEKLDTQIESDGNSQFQA